MIGPGGDLDPDMGIALLVSMITSGIIYAYLLAQRIEIAKVEEEVEYFEQVVQA